MNFFAPCAGGVGGGAPAAEPVPACIPSGETDVQIREFQRRIESIYFEKDARRGLFATFTWFVEEVGELARAVKGRDEDNLKEELGDVLAWLCTLASLRGIDLEEAARRYEHGCPRCGGVPCGCGEKLAEDRPPAAG